MQSLATSSNFHLPLRYVAVSDRFPSTGGYWKKKIIEEMLTSSLKMLWASEIMGFIVWADEIKNVYITKNGFAMML